MRTAKSEKSVLTEKKPLNDEDIWTYLPHSSPLQFVWLLILSLTGFFNGAISQIFIYIFITVINFMILFCISLLPETANFSLPQTVIDAVAATKDRWRNSAVQALIMNSKVLTTIGEVIESKKIETKFSLA